MGRARGVVWQGGGPGCLEGCWFLTDSLILPHPPDLPILQGFLRVSKEHGRQPRGGGHGL